jgi:mannose-6-phosphate isomerase-like protein (cupin superfamily)
MYKTNIEKVTLDNKYYRKVLFTTPQMQLVIMRLEPGEDIPLEIHQGTQFIRIESGKGVAKTPTGMVQLKDGVAIMIPANVKHYIKNTGSEPLNLYALYSPPEHEQGTKQYTQS